MHVMTINEVRFTLAPRQDLIALRKALTDAVRAGGAFVHLQTMTLGVVSVLVTPHSTVQFAEERELELVRAAPVEVGQDYWTDDF